VEELLAWTRTRTLDEAILASLVADVLVFAAALALGALVVATWRGKRVAAVSAPIDRLEVGLACACVVLNAGVMLVGWWMWRAGWLQIDATSAPLWWLVDAAGLTIVMDLAMYGSHRLAHLEPAFRWIHGIHHRYTQPRPLTLFVLHPLEVIGFGGLWIAVLHARAWSLGGMLIYLVLNTLFGVLGHVGVEPLPAAWARWPVVRHIGSSTFHARHHQLEHKNFGFYTAIWDRLFGTLDPDYEVGFAALPASRDPADR